ncbi:MAG: phosphoethanolamine transferase, partial [Opitutales bacterium]
YWLSNQQRMGVWDNAVSVLAERATNKTFINRGFGTSRKSQYHDEALLPYLAEALADRPGSKKLIIVHLMGSHFPYSSRYPPQFDKHHGRGETIDAYDNSIAYTDHFLGKLFRMAEEAGTSATVYFSDHGEDPVAGLGHNSTKMTKAMVEIPFIVQLSDQFMARYPQAVEQMAQSLDKPLTGDYIFNLLVWLMRIRGLDSVNPLLPDFSCEPRYTKNGELLYSTLK